MSDRIDSSTGRQVSTGAALRVGDAAPDFTLPDQQGRPVHLAERLGKGPIVVYFYPKDNTTGCTAEACAFRDSYTVFTEAGAEVMGISSDSVESHRRFAEERHLPFLLLSDEHASVRRLYKVPTTLGFLPGRVTYVLDQAGVIRHIFSSQLNATQHVKEALATISALRQGGHEQVRTEPGAAVE
ncbi:MAG: peroxiredoxin [Chloroflexi bacterium]|nr:MAG: peroxiredoxin [Chloroflexota bacterium]